MSNFFDGKAKVQVKDGKMKAYFNILENNDPEWIKSLIAHFDMTSNDETGIQFITEETVERTYDNGEKENFPSLMSLEFPEMQKEVLIGVNTKIPTTQDRVNRDWCRFLMDFDNMKFVNNLDDNKEDSGEKVEDTTGKKNENTEVNDNNKENETVLNKDNLNDGRYEVQLYLWNATKDAASMANDCFNHTALIDVKDGVKTISFTTKPMTFAGITANLDTLQYKDNTGNYVDAAVINTDENGKPNAFSFVLSSTEDYIDVMVNPHVAMMGNKPIAARLKIDYSTLKKAEGSVLDITKENSIESKNNDAAIIPNSSEVQAPAAGDNDVIPGNTVLVKTGDSMGKVLVITAISLMALAYTLENRSKRNLNKSN